MDDRIAQTLTAAHLTMPSRSAGVMASPFAGGCAVYDLVELRVTIVSSFAGVVLASAGEATEDLIAELSATTGEAPADVARAIRTSIDALLGAGLLGRDVPWDPTTAPSGSALVRTACAIGASQAVFDQRLAFRSADPELVAEIDSWIGVAQCDTAPNVIFDADPTPSGGVLLRAAEEWNFPDRQGFFVQLPGVINDFAGRNDQILVLHSGSVRDQNGRVTLLPGVPEAGKSTLTAALIMAGCDYLGDELVGVRADSLQAVGFPRSPALDGTSRRVLGLSAEWTSPYLPIGHVRPGAVSVTGDAGRVARVVLPTFDATVPEPLIEPVETPRETLEAMLGSAMNIPWVGEEGWATLCQLAEQVPTFRVRYPDAPAAAAALLAMPSDPQA